ncbi:MAG: IgGFc-binding protein [Polyangiaceae bacterium]
MPDFDRLRPARFASLLALAAAIVAACSASSEDGGFDNPSSGNGASGSDNGSGGGSGLPSGSGGGGGEFVGDPKTCDQAASSKSYLGCEFWPTVTGNNVWDMFDYAVVVANAGDETASIEVAQGGATIATATIGPNEAGKIFLPWVPALKGPQADTCGSATPLPGTVLAPDGAYHLTSSVPVTVYQFNALEYRGAGGPPGKSWAGCPGDQICPIYGIAVGCFSFSNDASLLLPSTALTNNYRVTAYKGWPTANIGGYAAVTATADDTQVTVYTSSTASVLAGGPVSNTGPNGTATFVIDAGDVVQLLSPPTGDLSGTLIQSNKPVQVITGMPCTQMPEGVQACDHIEESVFPAETLGKHYFVTVPTSPGGGPIGHVVRIFGNVDGTTLTYPSGAPPGAPTTIDAGAVVDLNIVSQSFEVQGDNAFAVASFGLSAELADPGAVVPDQKGDPDQSLMTAVEQFRDKYVFLAPDDYDVSYVDITQPMGAQVSIDGAPIGVAPTLIGSGYGIARVLLGPGNAGAHVLTADTGVGIQVMGYGAYTSYQYPGGLNLKAIAPPPEVPK